MHRSCKGSWSRRNPTRFLARQDVTITFPPHPPPDDVGRACTASAPFPHLAGKAFPQSAAYSQLGRKQQRALRRTSLPGRPGPPSPKTAPGKVCAPKRTPR